MITPGANRNLGAGRRWKSGGNPTRDVRNTLARVNFYDARKGRETQTSGGGRWVGATSRWTVAPRPGKLGGEVAGATI